MRNVLIAGALAASALATPSQAAVLASYDWDGAFTVASGVSGFISWGVTETSSAGPWNAGGWSGNYGAQRAVGDPASSGIQISLSGLPTHTAIDANFILGFLESWDGNDPMTGNCCSPDNLDVFIDGNLVAVLTSNSGNPGSNQFFAGGTVLANYQQTNGNGFFSDTLVDMSTASFLNFAHTGSTLDIFLRASGAGWQGGDDEGVGIDSLVINYTPAGAVPEPASWALMIAGFGLTGAALRKSNGRRRTKVRVTYA